jgi:hypothetical protein
MIFRGGGGVGGAWGQRGQPGIILYVHVCKRNWTRLITVLLVSFPVQRGGLNKILTKSSQKLEENWWVFSPIVRRFLLNPLSSSSDPSYFPPVPGEKDWQVYPVPYERMETWDLSPKVPHVPLEKGWCCLSSPCIPGEVSLVLEVHMEILCCWPAGKVSSVFSYKAYREVSLVHCDRIMRYLLSFMKGRGTSCSFMNDQLLYLLFRVKGCTLHKYLHVSS